MMTAKFPNGPGEARFDGDRASAQFVQKPELALRYAVGVREFVVLACVSECGEADARRIAEQLGLSLTSTEYCLDSLMKNDLVREATPRETTFLATEDGRSLIRKSAQAG